MTPGGLAMMGAGSSAAPASKYNLLTYTEQFDNSVWIKGAGVSVAANTITDPLGGTTADAITYSSAYGSMWQSPAVNSASLTQSIWLKVPSGTLYLYCGFYDSGDFDSDQVLLTTTWQKFSRTRAAGLTGGDRRTCWLYDASGSGGPVFHVWGASLTTTADAGLPYQWVTDSSTYNQYP